LEQSIINLGVGTNPHYLFNFFHSEGISSGVIFLTQ
jgi:hypothetical protein